MNVTRLRINNNVLDNCTDIDIFADLEQIADMEYLANFNRKSMVTYADINTQTEYSYPYADIRETVNDISEMVRIIQEGMEFDNIQRSIFL